MFNRLSDILKFAKQRYPALDKRMKEAEALSRWEAAVGPAIAKHSSAIRVQDSVLWVEVDHPIWKSELHYRKRQILEILNKNSESVSPKTEALTDILLLDRRDSR
jgi:predicted nucleic acid-binding Zn ribbon protein